MVFGSVKCTKAASYGGVYEKALRMQNLSYSNLICNALQLYFQQTALHQLFVKNFRYKLVVQIKNICTVLN